MDFDETLQLFLTKYGFVNVYTMVAYVINTRQSLKSKYILVFEKINGQCWNNTAFLQNMGFRMFILSSELFQNIHQAVSRKKLVHFGLWKILMDIDVTLQLFLTKYGFVNVYIMVGNVINIYKALYRKKASTFYKISWILNYFVKTY